MTDTHTPARLESSVATVLIVEDDPGIAELERGRLEDAGYRAVVAPTADEALAALAADAIDLILLDYRLPGGVNGLELYARVKAAGYDVPVILVTGFGSEATVIQALRVGVRDFVTKSTEYLDYLPDAVGRVLGQVRTEYQLASLIASAQDAIISTGPDRRVALFNPAAERMFRCPAPAAVGRPLADFIPDPLDATAGGPAARHARGVRWDGAEFPAEVSVSLGSAAGRRFYTLIVRDVTERERLAGERDALLARLRLQIERMPLAYMLFDADTRVAEWNPAAERIFGYTRAEALGMSGLDLVPPAARADSEAVLARVRGGDMSAHNVSANVTKDGRAITCEWHPTPLLGEDGRYAGFLCLAQDVTARIAAEEAVRVRDRAIRAVTQGILIADAGRPGLPAVFASPGFERLTGYAADEVLGRSCRFLQGKDTSADAVAQVRQAVRAGEPCVVELLNYRKDGAAFWNELSLSPVRDAAGRLTHFVGVQTDVTRRRNLEDQFRQAQKMEALGRLAGGVAHDFNNLLTVINGYSTLLLQGIPAGSPLREHAEEIRHAGRRSADLTRQLLAFSRQQVLAPRVLDLGAVVCGAEKLLRQLLGEDVRLRVAAGPGAWPVRADPGQLEQVLMNLAVNARDAMPTGGELTVEVRNVELDERSARGHPGGRPGPHVRLSVSDTGSGMSDEVKQRIFEPFFTTKGEGRGTGLGLSTVYGIVEQSGGHIAVTSAPGAGTRFDVHLPRAAAPGAAEPAAAPAAHPARGSGTILVVEDEKSVRVFSRLILAAAGYTVLEAASGGAAIDVARAHPGPIHLLLTDVVLPDISGRLVAERLRVARGDLRVLFMSGCTDDALLNYGIRRETDGFLTKPFPPDVLAAKVRQAIDCRSG